MESEQNYYKYIFLVVVILLFFYYVKRRISTGEPLKDRIWRKIAFSYQEMLHTFDAAEKELLKHTFHNTIFNSKGAVVTGDRKQTPKKKVSNVQFDLNKNETLYY